MNARNGVVALGIALALCAGALLLLVVVLAVDRGGAAAESAAADPVQVELGGVSDVICFNEQAYALVSRRPSDPPLVLPLRDGDIVFLAADMDDDSGFLLPYRRQEDGQALDVWFDGPVLRVRSHARCLMLNQEGLDWLSRAPDSQLAELRFVQVETLPPDAVAQLRRLADVNPHVGFGFGEMDDEIEWSDSITMTPELVQALTAFQPRSLMVPAEMLVFLKSGTAMSDSPPSEEERQWLESWSSDQARKQLFAAWSSTEMLITSAKTPQGMGVLADLPCLQSLVLFGWDPKDTGPMPAGLEGLTFLYLFGAGLDDLQGLSSLTGLQRLNVSLVDTLADISAIHAFPALRAVDLSWCDEVADLSPLFALGSLEHVGLPASATPAQLSELVEHLPGLHSLGLGMCEEIEDLRPLASLPALTRLTVGPKTDLRTLAGYSNLRYLDIRLPSDDDQATEQGLEVAHLRDALPDCRVVTSVGFCLGSGFLLLLVPAVVLARVLARRSRWNGTRERKAA